MTSPLHHRRQHRAPHFTNDLLSATGQVKVLQKVLLNQEDIYHIKSGFVVVVAINEGHARAAVVKITTFTTIWLVLGLLGRAQNYFQISLDCTFFL